MKDAKPLLQHILQSIELVERYIKGKDFARFERDPEMQDAVIRRLEVIGEAAKNIPDDFKARYPKAEWKKAAGMRDLLIHRYFSVDVRLLWDTVSRDLPVLKKEVQRIIEGIKEK